MSRPDSQVPYDPLENAPSSPFQGQFTDNTNSGSGASTPVLQGQTLVNSNTYNQSNQGRASEHGSALKGDETPITTAAGSRVLLNQQQDDPNVAQHFQKYPLFPQSTSEKQELFPAPRSKAAKKKGLIYALVAFLLIAVIAAVVIPVYFLVIKKNNSNSGGDGGGHSGGGNGGDHSGDSPVETGPPTTGGDGSIVTKDDGSTFIYNNTFGGFWVYDPQNPLNESAQAQSYTPPIGQEWGWGVDKIYGVNLGGWLTLEPFISPALYQPFDPIAVDEWSLCEQLMARDGNLNVIEEHYKTFITEEDFANVAAAGLNWVRIPISFWAIEKYADEPFLERVSWTYFTKAIQWARKYGLRINLDLHSIPGSQNGWNHSGKLGSSGFLNGAMGLANAQRTLSYIRIITEFISQPEYSKVVPFFGIMNEAYSGAGGFIPIEPLQAFYAEVYTMIRGITGIGAGKGPVISISESFQGMPFWAGFLQGADRLALDFHPYFVFGPQNAGPVESFIPLPCQNWAETFSTSLSTFGISTAGEWSFAINDCGLYLNDVTKGTRYDGTYTGGSFPAVGSCDQWNDYTTWTQETKDALLQLGLSHMDALQNWFFWTWKIGPSTAGKIETPFWSYSLGLEQGWSPRDPRTSAGQCANIGAPANTFAGPLQPWQIGGTGAGTVPSLTTYPWPPASISGLALADLAQYTATAPVPTLPVPTFAEASPSATVDAGDGWFNPDDNAPMYTPIAGCAYPDPWGPPGAAAPACAIIAQKRDAVPTPAPL